MFKPIVVATAALCVHVFALVSLSRRIEPFVYNFYVLSWWSYIFFIDAILSLKQSRFLITDRSLPYLALVSCAFWCIFELVNLRLKNWFYINVPSEGYLRYVGYLIAFGTVIPAVYVTKEAVHRLVGAVAIKSVRLPQRLSPLFLSGFVMLMLVLFFPSFFFALTWVFLIPVMDVINYGQGYTSFIGELKQGKAGGLISTLLAGMICGFLWEVWNYWAISKWVYTVPLFEDVKVFEMPVLGYLGFAFFAVEAVAFLNFFREAELFKAHVWGVAFLALVFSLGTFILIDRHTVFSRLPRVYQLSFIPQPHRENLSKQAVISSYALNRSTLSPEERQILEMIELKGLGIEHAMRLRERGVGNISSLSALSPAEMCTIIGEPEERRCRIYIKAASGS